MESIGKRISRARRYLNINQKELCKKANITEASLSRYENEIREPKAAVVALLADALGVSTDYLLGLTDDINFKRQGLGDKSEEDLETIIANTEKKIRREGISFSGKPASKEAIDSVLTAIKMGMLLALEEQNKK
ncbi:helix-turn-helix transcriptional regulator [Romboutsia sedimentorum]|uniref:Helix-turn-helix transcriptional regulator n=1 Tax=Romboutsia sedimentorum TaxID=1368474 RepID=A0ABT7E8M0_9FIRM|nr:helix-turn-helix transcriptional regulator [Romboutsia sedimentorum]MDK2563270.1 helix-turn-helix transcriptional regulator [Romboutsia sedimentorum]MDK2584997.1 helix-turn-helix transcriptional regulator [Romboutsia sedimentorum]